MPRDQIDCECRQVKANPSGHPTIASDRLASLEAELCEARAEVKRSRMILGSAVEYAIVSMDTDGCITSWNAGAERIIGYSEAEVLGRSGEIVFTSEDRAQGRFATELRRALDEGRAVNERWHVHRDGTRFWASGMMMALRDPGGDMAGFLNILRDRTELRAEVERRELLMAEMNHRIKNTFAIVQSVAAQTRRHAASIDDFEDAFVARLRVLARSHDEMIEGDWKDAPLRDVVEGALDASGAELSRFNIEGASLVLPASLVVTVSLAFHELATNALKYGALSNEAGRVCIAWTTGHGGPGRPRVEITWRERGGPPVRVPDRRGFGSQLLEQGMPAGGTVRLEFLCDGLQCHMRLPLGEDRFG